jgi:hypothetical protein
MLRYVLVDFIIYILTIFTSAVSHTKFSKVAEC